MFNTLNAGARALYWLFQETDRGVTRPIADAAQQGGHFNFSLGDITRPLFGRIVDTAGVAHCYKVLVERGMPTITAVHLAGTSLSACGARQLNTLQPGQGVWLLWHRLSYHGYIIGVEPSPMLAANRSLVGWISRATRNRVDKAGQRPLLKTDNGGVSDWQAGRPFDGSSVGEAGWICETGMKIFVDPFMAILGLDEYTGLFAFYHDQLVRLAGHNLQIYDAGSEREGLLDELEYILYQGYTPYPWEHLGLFDRGDPTKQKSAEEVQLNEPYYAAREPKEDNQQAWHRSQIYQGYLGQAGKRIVVTRPQSPFSDKQLTMPSEPEFPGLFEENCSLSGQYSVRSAKGIWMVKSPHIPTAKRIARPEDPGSDGDNDKNYKFAGLEGGGQDHKVTGNVKTQGEFESFSRVVGALDLQSYVYNWEGLHPFHYHERDWYLPEESDLEYAASTEAPKFADLDGKQNMDPPNPFFLQIDHRYNQVQYFPNRSYFGMLEDGGVVLGDGFGAELRMVGGSVYITAPGDVWLKSGKNINQWAGFDLNMRAQNSADLSATMHDVRIKAEKNLQLLAGNDSDDSDEQGGILLESRASSATFDFADKTGEEVESAGIMFKSKTAPIVGWSKDIYLRTGGGQGDNEIEEGDIILDAAKGKRDVIMHASEVHTWLRSKFNMAFGTEGEFRGVNEFSQYRASISGELQVNGPAVINGGLIVDNSVQVASGHISTSQAKSADGQVSELKGRPLDLAKTRLRTIETSITETLPQQAQSEFDDLRTNYYYPDKPGNDVVISNVGFSFRKEEEYQTEDWRLFEDRWQQIARLSQENLPKWKERSVKAGSATTYPYPGENNFVTETLYTQDLKGFEMDEYRAKDRNDGFYDDPELEQPQAKTLNDDYLVVVEAE